MKNEKSLLISSEDEDDVGKISTSASDPVICVATSRLNAKDRVEVRKSDFLRIEGL